MNETHFGDEYFQAITCTGTDNSKQTGENTSKTPKNKLTLGSGSCRVCLLVPGER